MRYSTRMAAILALSLASTPLVHADLIELNDGRRFDGSLLRSDDSITIRTQDGQIIFAKPKDIAKVTLTGVVTPEEAAAAEWTRISAVVKSADSIQAVLTLYQNFVAKFPDAKQSPDAQAALTSFQKIAQNDPVKFRGRWMPRAQVEVLVKQWTEAARPALALYKSGRMKEVLDAVKGPLAEDPQNPDLLTLAGLAAYRLNAIPLARTHFTALAAADPSSLLAENNLGVISFQQKQAGEGLIHYTRALQINADNRLVLDNIAEALNAYVTANGDRNGVGYRGLIKLAEAAELRMEEQMAKQGLQRRGSTWVTAEQNAALAKYQDELKNRLGQIESQYRTARDTLAALDAQIKQADADYENYVQMYDNFDNLLHINSSPFLDNSYNIVQRDIAFQNMDRISRQKATLIAQRSQYIAGSRDFISQVERLRTALASSSLTPTLYTGTQRILDYGEATNPPAPTKLPELPALPNIQAPPNITVIPPAQPPVIVPVQVNLPVYGPVH